MVFCCSIASFLFLSSKFGNKIISYKYIVIEALIRPKQWPHFITCCFSRTLSYFGLSEYGKIKIIIVSHFEKVCDENVCMPILDNTYHYIKPYRLPRPINSLGINVTFRLFSNQNVLIDGFC